MSTIEVNREVLYSIYTDIRGCVERLEVLLANVGCLHMNRFDVTTLGSPNRRYVCPDCGETIVEEFDVQGI